jgi:hypothetical protein
MIDYDLDYEPSLEETEVLDDAAELFKEKFDDLDGDKELNY